MDSGEWKNEFENQVVRRINYMNRESFLTFILFILGSTVYALNPDNFVFKAGESGYFCFRAPTMVVTQNFNILAFSEGRVNSGADEGDMDIDADNLALGGKINLKAGKFNTNDFGLFPYNDDFF